MKLFKLLVLLLFMPLITEDSQNNDQNRMWVVSYDPWIEYARKRDQGTLTSQDAQDINNRCYNPSLHLINSDAARMFEMGTEYEDARRRGKILSITISPENKEARHQEINWDSLSNYQTLLDTGKASIWNNQMEQLWRSSLTDSNCPTKEFDEILQQRNTYLNKLTAIINAEEFFSPYNMLVDYSKVGKFEKTFSYGNEDQITAGDWKHFFTRYNKINTLDCVSRFNLYHIDSYVHFLKSLQEWDFYVVNMSQELLKNPDFGKVIKKLKGPNGQRLEPLIHQWAQESINRQMEKFDEQRIARENSMLNSNNTIDESYAEHENELTNHQAADYSAKNTAQRILALNKAQRDKNIFQKNYNVSSSLEKYLNQKKIDKNLFSDFKGNFAQHQLHNELLSLAECVAIDIANSKIYELNRFYDTTMWYVQEGCYLNQQSKLGAAYSFADLAHDCVAFSRGVVKAGGENLEQAKHLITHPLESTGQLYQLAKNLTYSTAKVVLHGFMNLPHAVMNPTETAGKVKDGYETLKEISLAIYDQLKNTPRETLFENAGYIITDLVAGYFKGGVYSKVGRFFLLKASHRGAKLLKRTLGNNAKEAAEIIGLATEKHPNEIIKGIDFARKNSNLLYNEKKLASKVSKSCKYLKNQKTFLKELREFNKTLKNNKPMYDFLTAHGLCGVFLPAGNTISSIKIFTDGKFIYFLDKFGNVYQKAISSNGKFYIVNSKSLNKKFASLQKFIERESAVLKKQVEKATKYKKIIKPLSRYQEMVNKIKSIIIKSGKKIGEKGSSDRIRILRGTEKVARNYFNNLAKRLGLNIKSRTTNRGEELLFITLPNKGCITYRPISTSGPPTIDFHIKEIEKIIEKIKFDK